MLGLLTALEPEAKSLPDFNHWAEEPSGPVGVFARPGGGVLLAVSGMGGAKAALGVRALVQRGVSAVVVFGTCGGLDPDLKPGDLILASRLAGPSDEDAVQAPAGLLSRVRLALDKADLSHPPYRIGTLATVDEPVRSPQAKAGLFARSGALGVAMEDLGAAAAAAEVGVELVVLRAVVDPADCAVAPEMAQVIDGRGRVKSLQLTKALLRRPSLGAELAAMGGRFGAAKKALTAALASILTIEI